MRAMHFLVALAAAIFVAAPSAAQTPPNVLFAGSANSDVARGTNVWCAVEPGSATFQRNGTGQAKITLPEVTWINYAVTPAVSYRLGGLLILSFSATANGAAAFVVPNGAPSSVSRPAFTNYIQSYSAASQALSVSFVIRFPICALPVRLLLRN